MTLKIRMMLISVLFIVSHAGFAVAQQGPLGHVNIGHVPMHCISANGQRVAIYIDSSVDQNIGRAMNNGYPIIILGPGFFNRVPPLVGQFWFLHECAHHVVGGNEAAADCYAIRNLRNIGLIRHPRQINELLFQISQMSGSFTHLPGRARAQNIFRCLNS